MINRSSVETWTLKLFLKVYDVFGRMNYIISHFCYSANSIEVSTCHACLMGKKVSYLVVKNIYLLEKLPLYLLVVQKILIFFFCPIIRYLCGEMLWVLSLSIRCFC